MRLVFFLALRDLARERFQLVCNVATLAGVLVPLLVLFGVKNGIYDALIGRLLSNPATLQIDTAGNTAFVPADAELVRSWPEVGFVTLKTRSLFDFVNVRPEDGRGKRDALLVPSGTGDPMLPAGLVLGPDQVAVSGVLAAQLELGVGDILQIVTQAPERPRQLLLRAEIATVLPVERINGRAVLANIDVLDLIEAFYDEYALPEHGITQGKPLAQRMGEFEGLRVYARELQSLAPLQARIEAQFGVRTEADTAAVENVLGLGRNLNLALLLVAGFSTAGLSAALIFGFWGNVARRKSLLATLALLGFGGRHLWLFPVIQAAVSAVVGLVVSFVIFAGAAVLAEGLFGAGVTAPGGLVSLGFGQALIIVCVVMVFVLAASFAAARSAAGTDPATVLREGAT